MTPPDIASDGDGDSQESTIVNFLDVVATKGAYLLTRLSSPVHPRTYNDDEAFITTLHSKLEILITIQAGRGAKYGNDVAEEWPIGHTPTEVVESRRAEVKRRQMLMEAPTPPSGDGDGGDGARAMVDPLEDPAAPAIANLFPCIPTPSPTLETPDSRGAILPGAHPSVAAPDITVNKATQGRKCQRDAHEEAEVEGRPTKVRKTAADARPRRRTRPRRAPS